ncbi:MAG: hypothetical protein JHD02_03590 [Thermoleophilaceae bacterium]|nr:hypothetical protein [Thermoleophilaceae bacterium]
MPGSAMATWLPAGFSESTTGVTQNPVFPDTVASVVTVDAPLPASFAAHPAQCDKLQFLRIRHEDGPADPSDADRVLTAQPGIFGGAATFLNVGGNVVTRARTDNSKYVEFWAIDRRPNCLEDLNGFRLAKATGNPVDFANYYYRAKPFNGARFGGFLNPLRDAAWLVDMGIGQTVRDWNTIITRGIPSQLTRQQILYCGGHSLGGSITGAYAEWDFDGNPGTLGDAGYNQCAGFFALDSQVAFSGADTDSMDDQLSALTGAIPTGVTALMRAGLFERFISLPTVIDPEIINLLGGLGVAAELKPTSESNLLINLPPSANIDPALKLFFSRNLLDYLAQGVPSIKTFRLTNEAMLGTFTDDNAVPLSLIQTSSGFYKGGSVADKDFPIPGDLPGELQQITAMLGGPQLAIPTNNGIFGLFRPLYGWNNFNQVTSSNVPRNSKGAPYTSPAKEVSAIADVARTFAAVPMDFSEKYFPLQLTLDSGSAQPDRVHTNVSQLRPVLNVIAGEGLNPGSTAGPVVAGYNHIDVLTASPTQNDGQPEPVTTNLLDLLF